MISQVFTLGKCTLLFCYLLAEAISWMGWFLLTSSFPPVLVFQAFLKCHPRSRFVFDCWNVSQANFHRCGGRVLLFCVTYQPIWNWLKSTKETTQQYSETSVESSGFRLMLLHMTQYFPCGSNFLTAQISLKFHPWCSWKVSLGFKSWMAYIQVNV